MSELLLAGIDATNDPNAVDLHVWIGDLDRDGDVDHADFGEVARCLSGPGGEIETGFEPTDFDTDGEADLSDFAAFQRTFTGRLQ
jgi:hypothetical protein